MASLELLHAMPCVLAALVLIALTPCTSIIPTRADDSTDQPIHCNVHARATCHQYRHMGHYDVTCDVTKYDTCGQICNSAKCNLQCAVKQECNQTCIAGRCVSAVCSSRMCNQTCIRAGCKMECYGEECHQTCQSSGCDVTCPAASKVCVQVCITGRCTMRCGRGVGRCEQKCLAGKCAMICEARECVSTCSDSDCVYKESGIRVVPTSPYRPMRQCNKPDDSETCIQNCTEGRCKLANLYGQYDRSLQVCAGGYCSYVCKAPLLCNQVCTGGNCMRYSCTTEYCVQECVAGECEMDCDSKTCFQIARGGRTTMRCSPTVDKCHQFCPGGDCNLICQAKLCYPHCPSGGCVTSNIKPRIVALPTRVRCEVISGGCSQNCHTKRSCICRRFSALFHSCDQLCYEGSCRSMKCYSLNKCNQVCEDGRCQLMLCKSDLCVQDCRGADCFMECRARNCTQLCPRGGCRMRCTSRVDKCVQACNPREGQCRFECHAKSCSVTML
ncbi:multiple epidermal growth factor-like domains protein 11 isoform X4 [Nematostella vectensis]|uniref:multiple epidermal growth factor-like domains protein 11 isoform X4 n=1 Tax=Nematostella vectensis TaxID=45351 RepID=UPI0020772F67|nr:multiple epidermal growth factor-like domains protein 11 isoform X4 [Nematostella vectensis]